MTNITPFTATDRKLPINEVIVNPEKYYGVKSPFRKKGFITRDQFESGLFKVMCPDQLTNGNCWNFKDESLAGLINHLRVGQQFTVFEFDTFTELFRWLGES